MPRRDVSVAAGSDAAGTTPACRCRPIHHVDQRLAGKRAASSRKWSTGCNKSVAASSLVSVLFAISAHYQAPPSVELVERVVEDLTHLLLTAADLADGSQRHDRAGDRWDAYAGSISTISVNKSSSRRRAIPTRYLPHAMPGR